MDCAVFLEGVHDLQATNKKYCREDSYPAAAVTAGPTPFVERAIDRKA
jgi:hypothetical protein